MVNLLCLFLFPVISALVLLLLPIHSGKNLKKISLSLSLVPLAALIIGSSDWMGMEVNTSWIPQLSVRFHLVIDDISLLFLFLACVVIPYSIIAWPSSTKESPKLFYCLILFLQTLLIGFFTARDLALFTVFWEAILIPLYLMILLWGKDKRQDAATKFIVYMVAGSCLMVAAVLFLYLSSTTTGAAGTFNLDLLAKTASLSPYAGWIFAVFMLAFSVKAPLFPFHAWLPDAYYESPTSATILLSAVLSKAGIYGVLRIALPLFPELSYAWSPLFLSLAIAGVFYGALLAWYQEDYKRLLSYSSLSHVNFILAGLFVMNSTALVGGVLQAINHGITITALFLVAGWLEERLGSTSLRASTGLCTSLPRLTWLTFFFVLASVALPATNNFVGELMILFGLFVKSPVIAAILGISIILSVVYMLRWMQLEYFGKPGPNQDAFVDLRLKQIALALPLVLLILWVGIYPMPIINLINLNGFKPIYQNVLDLSAI